MMAETDEPKFMVYDIDKEEMVQLTQKRLDHLLAVERAYGQLRLKSNDIQAELAKESAPAANTIWGPTNGIH